ncbi:diacylglycerol acyltransferase-domain-containing protein [Apiosordaria backusii]|uniref:diacylglycerol O-acyltransferase n=1 Tax=Apiosordaria backusii TaxID=314023 RepID=A0AA40AN43_9PEZI|nr:diacylglycerol acyltransferase-domain-containing protein [Apiosordaria backusii]
MDSAADQETPPITTRKKGGKKAKKQQQQQKTKETKALRPVDASAGSEKEDTTAATATATATTTTRTTTSAEAEAAGSSSVIEDTTAEAAPSTPKKTQIPKKQKSNASLDGHMESSPSSSSSKTQSKSIGSNMALAESTGDLAEKEADEVPVKTAATTLSSKGVQVNGVNGIYGGVDGEKERSNGKEGGQVDGVRGSEANGSGLVQRKPKKGSVIKAWDNDYPPLYDDDDRDERRLGRLNAYRAAGIRFAPWNIPYRRRMQTVAVIIHCLSIASTVSFFFFLCAIPILWPLLIPYLLHMLLSKNSTDGRLRMRSERWRRLPVWKLFGEYFPAKLHKTHDLPPTRKYIFGYHPHGIISHGAFAAFATEALGFSEKFPGITNSLLTLDSNFRIPLYRDYILAFGLQSVSKDSITNILSKGGPNNEGMGRAVTIVVGGARESLEAQPGVMNLVLADRKGFVKMAIRTGADLVPVLAFGENDLYDQLSPKTHPWLHKAQMWVLRTLKFTLPFLHGRGIFNYDVGLMPYRRRLNVVVGKPIKVAQKGEGEIENEEVDRLHAEYLGELEKMWERYKGVFAPGRRGEMNILK